VVIFCRSCGSKSPLHPISPTKAVEVITTARAPGQIGDGKIFVTPIDHALRIRTGETDSDAL